MRVAMLHNEYLQSGGEDVVFASETELLRRHGCTVDLYHEHNEKIARLGALRTGLRSIWSRDSYRRIRAMLRAERYDAMHVHNFFPLISPSAYFAARAEGVPVVQTLHNYRLMCPPGTLLRDGLVCEDCLGRKFALPGVLHRCYRGSAAASGAAAAMVTANRLLGTWRNMVDVYIALTEFGRRKFVEGGLPADRIMVKPNFVRSDPGPGPGGDGGPGYALFVGRLSPEKGIDTLLSAWRLLGPRITLKVIGDGPMRAEVESAAAGIDGLEYLGWQERDRLMEYMGRAEFLVVPSIWYEPQSLAAVEALACGTPVIAADIGALSEVVAHGETGLLFRPGDAVDLAAKVERLLANDDERRAMRGPARASFEARYTADRNYRMLMEIYAAAAARSRATR